ncbi:hypothetical protein QBC38DRAFT_478414 [Podospora fimiseda]|uniref:Transmembrane protein n=1 Tax=Podospora fimiseda TaxID=252190 RepID=A0AAN7BPH6_9PEZI|nr:hypothetical protein QBC38DRAFT_478414 [Podospora fimiseda]
MVWFSSQQLNLFTILFFEAYFVSCRPFNCHQRRKINQSKRSFRTAKTPFGVHTHRPFNMSPVIIIPRASRLAPRFGPGNNRDDDNQNGFNPSPFQGKGGFFEDKQEADDEDGINIPPAAIVGIVVSIVVFFLLTTGFCVYKDRQRRRLAREKQVEIALKQTPSYPAAVHQPQQQLAVPVVVPGANLQDAPPPYEAAHIANRHPAAVHQWNPRDVRNHGSGGGGSGIVEEDITGAASTITDGIPPEAGGKNTGLRIGS